MAETGRPGDRDPGGPPRAKRSLGQNFLVDPNLQRKVVGELEAGETDVVLEVGSGHGELSRHLVGVVGQLILIEKDTRLAEALSARWGERAGVQVVQGDALDLPLAELGPPKRRVRLLSNVPYNLTSPLLFAFLRLDPPARRIVVTVQKEVAERIVAAPGSKRFGALTVGVQCRAEARLAFSIGRQAFRPVPAVDSAVVTIDPDPDRIRDLPADELRLLTRVAFGMRRKQLQKILRVAPEYALSDQRVRALCRGLDVAPSARPETLTPAQFVALARALEAKR